jgi:hypothetical protein
MEVPPSNPRCIYQKERRVIYAGDFNIIKGMGALGVTDELCSSGSQSYAAFRWCSSDWSSSELLLAIQNTPVDGAAVRMELFERQTKNGHCVPVAVSLLEGWSVVLWVGMNDLLSAGVHAPDIRAAVDLYKENIKKIIAELKEREVKFIYLVTPHSWLTECPLSGPRMMRQVLLDIAEAEDPALVLIFVDVFTALTYRKGGNRQTDVRFLVQSGRGTELSDLGYDIFHGSFYRALHDYCRDADFPVYLHIDTEEVQEMVQSAWDDWDRELEPMLTGEKNGLESTKARCDYEWKMFNQLLKESAKQMKRLKVITVTESKMNLLHGKWKYTIPTHMAPPVNEETQVDNCCDFELMETGCASCRAAHLARWEDRSRAMQEGSCCEIVKQEGSCCKIELDKKGCEKCRIAHLTHWLARGDRKREAERVAGEKAKRARESRQESLLGGFGFSTMNGFAKGSAGQEEMEVGSEQETKVKVESVELE